MENGGAIYLGFVSLWSHWKGEVVENIFVLGKKVSPSQLKLLGIVSTRTHLSADLVDTAEL